MEGATQKHVPVVVVVDDDPVDLQYIEAGFAQMSLVRACAVLCRTIEEAIKAVQEKKPLFVLLDDRLGPSALAEDSIARLREAGYSSRIVVMSGSITGRRHDALRALGCFEVVEKDELGPDALEMLVVTIYHVQRLNEQSLARD